MDTTQQHEHDCFSDLVTLKWKLVWYHNKGVMNNNTRSIHTILLRINN